MQPIARSPVKLRLPEAAENVAVRYRIPVSTYGVVTSHWSELEWAVHELAHAITLGLHLADTGVMLDDRIAEAVNALPWYAQDLNEAWTCAVELDAMAMLGAPKYTRKLLAQAAFGLRSRHGNSQIRWIRAQVRMFRAQKETRLLAEQVVRLVSACN